MRHLPINPELFILNRQNFIKHLKPSSMAIFNSNDQMPKSADQYFPFHQNVDLFYLSGIDQEQSILILYPDCPLEKFRKVLFLREPNEHIKVWEGQKYTQEEATSISGIKTVLWLDRFDATLNELMSYTENVYLNANEHPRFSSDVVYKDMRLAKMLKKKYPIHNYCRIAPIMNKLRTIKSKYETELIQHACDITEKAFMKILKFIRPGVMEYEVQAEIEHDFIRNRATGQAYQSIIASGESACILHYVNNDKECKDGDLVLMDFGCEYAHYISDMSRTVPVNGKFTLRQMDCYNAVLRVMKEAINLIVVGCSINEFHAEVCKMMEKEMIVLGLFTGEDIKKQDAEKPLFLKYLPHGISHFIGLDVHDLGTKHETFKPGMVLTCEPGLYIPGENIGIRIENNILVTENGPVDLMKNIPVEVEEIEELMSRD